MLLILMFALGALNSQVKKKDGRVGLAFFNTKTQRLEDSKNM
ncbi:MAG TPA: hypothetical protein VEK08_18915 [Planctomycetota bacterium]|nr:hypothetical protein [Planctomycetota bacterium]